MNGVEAAIRIVDLFNLAAPGLATLIMLIKRKDGGISVVTLLDETDQQFNANLTMAKDWLAAHPVPAPPQT